MGTPLTSISKAPSTAGSSVACWPIQRIMAAGSVRWRKTSSTGAGSSISVAKGSVTPWPSAVRRIAGGLQRGAELAQVGGPEVGQELLHGAEAFRVDQEQVPRALAVLVHDASLVQHLEMPRDRLRGDVKVARDVTDRARIAGDELKDGAGARVGERPEGRVRVQGPLPRAAPSAAEEWSSG